MQIIEIRQTRYGEVAYVFDEKAGEIVKLPVKDLTGYNDTEDEQEPRQVIRRAPPVRRPVTGQETEGDFGQEVPRKLPDKPKSIMPPGMAGIFGGRAEERRIA